jgi:hypothetical protein
MVEVNCSTDLNDILVSCGANLSVRTKRFISSVDSLHRNACLILNVTDKRALFVIHSNIYRCPVIFSLDTAPAGLFFGRSLLECYLAIRELASLQQLVYRSRR